MAVLISTHGHSPFLPEQFESICAALGPRDVLVMVDDGSSKVNWSALVNWPLNYLCWSRLEPLGSSVSFMDLLLNAPVRAAYYCWADQDDVWRRDKIARQIGALTTVTRAWACVHGWRLLQQSREGIWATTTAHIPLLRRSPAHYCFETPAPGMTLCVTEQARQSLKSLDEAVIYRLLSDLPHDRLACAILSMDNRLHCIADPLVDYRQHANNQVGAQNAGMIKQTVSRLNQWGRIRRAVRAGCALYEQLRENMANDSRPLPPLYKMPLRSKAWENRILHVLVRWWR